MIGQFIRRVTGQGGTLTLDDPTGWYSSDRPLFGGKEMQAMKLPAVNACIEIISDSIAKMPVYLMDSGTRERVTDHPALRLLTGRPTEALTAFDYHKLMESRRIAYGNAYALILRDKWGVPVELLPIAPGYMMPLLDSNAKLWYVGINPKTQEYRKFWPEDVLHYKAFSTDGLEGVSYLRRGAETIETALQAQRYEGNYYKNGGQVSGVLATETDLSSKTRFDENGNAIDLKNRIRENWESIHSGADNAFRIAVLDNGLKYTPLTATNRDAQFIETKAASVEDIARLFNIPFYKLGAGKESYAANTQAAIEYMQRTPRQTRTGTRQSRPRRARRTTSTSRCRTARTKAPVRSLSSTRSRQATTPPRRAFTRTISRSSTPDAIRRRSTRRSRRSATRPRT